MGEKEANKYRVFLDRETWSKSSWRIVEKTSKGMNSGLLLLVTERVLKKNKVLTLARLVWGKEPGGGEGAGLLPVALSGKKRGAGELFKGERAGLGHTQGGELGPCERAFG